MVVMQVVKTVSISDVPPFPAKDPGLHWRTIVCARDDRLRRETRGICRHHLLEPSTSTTVEKAIREGGIAKDRPLGLLHVAIRSPIWARGLNAAAMEHV